MRAILIAGTVCALAAVASAQNTTLTQEWKVELGSRDWFTTPTNNVRSAAYNPATDRITVVSKDKFVYGVDSFIEIDPATGADISTNTLVSGGIGHSSDFFVNKHAHDDNGVAYITNLSVNTATTTFVIYRLASANDSLTTAFEGNTTGVLGLDTPNLRLGDTVDVVGSGVNTEIWCGTKNTVGPHLIKFTTADGLNFTPSLVLTIPDPPSGPWPGPHSPTYRGLSVKGTGPNATIWVNDVNTAAHRINAVTGAIEDTIDTSVLSVVHTTTQLGYFEAHGQKFVGLGPGALTDTNFETFKPGYLVNVSVPATKYAAANTESLRAGIHPNGNGTGSVIFDPVRNNVIFLTTNGVLSAHNVPASLNAAENWSLFD